MSTTAEQTLAAVIDSYLDGSVNGRSFIRKIDDLVSNDQLTDLTVEIRPEFDRLHEALALCVWDDMTEADGGGLYIREPEMKSRVVAFRRSLSDALG